MDDVRDKRISELKTFSSDKLIEELCKAVWWDNGGTAQQYLSAELLRRLDAPAGRPNQVEKIAEDIAYWMATNPEQKKLYKTEISAILARHLSGEKP